MNQNFPITSNILCDHQRNMWFCIIDARLWKFSVDWFPEMLFIEIAAFSWWNLGATCLNSSFGFQKELDRRLYAQAIIYTTSPFWMKTGFCFLWFNWSVHLRPHRLFHLPYSCSIHFVLPIMIISKTGTFSLYLSEEWHVKYDQVSVFFFFFHNQHYICSKHQTIWHKQVDAEWF